MKLFFSPRLLLGLAFGLTLRADTVQAATNLLGITYGHDMFVAVGYDASQRSVVLVSSDGLNWTNQTPGSFAPLAAVTFGHDTLVAVGQTVLMTSTTGGQWATRRWRGDPYLADVIYANGIFVAVGSGNAILTSPDGSTWAARRLSASYPLRAIAQGNGQFVAAGGYQTVLTSTDAVSWNSHPINLRFIDVTYGNGLFLACADPHFGGPGLWTSVNGSVWTRAEVLADAPVSRLEYVNGRFFALRTEDVLQTSTDAVTWTTVNCGLNRLQAVTHGDGRYLAVGDSDGSAFGMVSSPDGMVWTKVLEPLREPVIHLQPQDQVAGAGNEVSFAVEAFGNPAPSYRWRFQEADLAALPSRILRLPNVVTNQAGEYSVVLSNHFGAVTSAVATLTVTVSAPVFTTQPEDSTVLEGHSLQLSAHAQGAPSPRSQWYFNDVALPAGTNEYLWLPNVTASEGGLYWMVASNALGLATSAVATVIVTQQAAAFLNEPCSHAALAGTNVQFCPEVVAGPPATFQWQHDGVNLPGATGNCLSLFRVLPAHAGVYSLVASNRVGVVTGTVATLTVTPIAPTVANLQLSSPTVVEGNQVTFSAQSQGAPPPELYLQFNGTNLALPWQTVNSLPAAGQRFALLEATPADTGEYAVVASNFVSSVTSQVARLTVTPAGPLDRWARRNPRPQGYNLLAVAEGSGRLVAVGDRGAILTSPDGTNWAVQPLRADVSLRDIAFGQGTFVVVGNAGTVLTSPDGTNWTLRSSGQAEPIISVTYGNGQFVAISQRYDPASLILSSPDGITWSGQYLPEPFWVADVTYGNGQFVAVGYGNAVWTSPDGIAWTRQPLSQYVEMEGVAFLNGQFIAVGDDGEILVSPDGAGWTPRGTSTTRRLQGVTYAAGQYVAVGARGVIVSSPDALHWRNETSGTPDRLEDVLVFGDVLVALGENGTTVTSSDGVAWARQNRGTTRDLDGMVVGNDLVVVVGKNGTILTSTHGTDYVEQTSGTADNLHGVAFDHGLFMAVGEPGTVLTSGDGTNWTRQNTSSRSSLKRVAYGQGLWAAVGTEGTILTSPDGTQWTQRDAGTFEDLNDVASGNGMFVVVGDQTSGNGMLLTSADGVNWTDRSLETGKNLRAVAFGGGLFMALGNDGVIRVSADGLAWSPRTSGIHYDGGNLRGLSHTNGTWIVVGNDGLILTSTNTFDWTRRASRTLENLHGVQFFHDSFITMGNRGNILQSGRTLGAVLSVRTYDPAVGFELAIQSEPGQQHRLQASTDLWLWTDLLTFENTQATTLFLDAEALLHRCRFYRVVSP